MGLPVDPARYLAFCAISLVFAFTPGPAVLVTMATGVRSGHAAALRSVAGISFANLLWFGAAALGLGALEAAFPLAFSVLRWAGVAYILWLAFGAFRSGLTGGASHLDDARGSARPFRDALLVQITNPKALLFITVILPPFIDPERPAGPQLAMLALAAIGLDAVGLSTYGLSGATLSAWLQRPAFQRGFQLMVGVLLLCAAALIVLELRGR